MSNKRTLIDEYELLCLCIEGGLATSTTDFIQTIIDKFKNRKDIRACSLVKRLQNIKEDLIKEETKSE